MTHCDGYRAAAVSRRLDVAALGIDAEPHAPLPPGLLRRIASPSERGHLTALRHTRPALHWDRLFFSAKESVYKAWFPAGGPSPSFSYWLTLISTHVVANSVCVIVCCWYGLRTNDRPLATALWLFASGTALATLFWIGRLLRLMLDVSWGLPYLPLLINLHALLRATAILVPTAVTLALTLANARTVWRLWPLWHELVAAVPHVVLTRRRTRLLELVWPPVPHRLLAYRKLIEIRDAMLELDHYVPPELPLLARDHVRPLDLTPVQADAVVLACVMKEAHQARLAGSPRCESPAESFDHGKPPLFPTRQEHASTLTAEKTHLIGLARAYTSAPVRSFVTSPHRRAPRHREG
ncbi:DUF6545 domain-containing protein [Streptomyces sp. ME02-8801-2C]|uniref:DUF6545 domain-containing protein n=1 Tax=Streptomyces sp. ME02-8801-2C TaxID=3028680 RepID=UPI0029C0FCA1|nr:DUF6545 domain-containing protein [Streptomyces sp. ME02-8801-2C]